jgi:hypothetical protein
MTAVTTGRDKARKSFFSEEKKQKTFIHEECWFTALRPI